MDIHSWAVYNVMETTVLEKHRKHFCCGLPDHLISILLTSYGNTSSLLLIWSICTHLWNSGQTFSTVWQRFLGTHSGRCLSMWFDACTCVNLWVAHISNNCCDHHGLHDLLNVLMETSFLVCFSAVQVTHNKKIFISTLDFKNIFIKKIMYTRVHNAEFVVLISWYWWFKHEVGWEHAGKDRYLSGWLHCDGDNYGVSC